MNSMNNLTPGQYIIIQDLDIAYVCLTKGNYKIGNEEELYTVDKMKSTFLVMASDVDNIYQEVNQLPKVLEWVHYTTGEVVDADTFRAMTGLKIDGDEYGYTSLEEEFFIRQWIEDANAYLKPIYAPNEKTFKKVSLSLIGKINSDTGSKFIIPLLFIGTPSDRGLYHVETGKIAHDQFLAETAKLQSKYSKIAFVENASHSNIKYAKVNGVYAFTSYEDKCYSDINAKQLTADLDAAVQLENDIRNSVTVAMNGIFLQINEISAPSVSSVMKELLALQSNINEIVAIKKSEDKLRSAKNKTRSLIKTLEQATFSAIWTPNEQKTTDDN